MQCYILQVNNTMENNRNNNNKLIYLTIAIIGVIGMLLSSGLSTTTQQASANKGSDGVKIDSITIANTEQSIDQSADVKQKNECTDFAGCTNSAQVSQSGSETATTTIDNP
jgi:hypothetical protein